MAQPSSTGRATPRGTDLFQEINAPGSGQPFAITYWDLWFGVVLLTEFGGDWTALIEHFRRKVRGGMDRYGAEPMLSHALHLRRRLEEAHLPPEALLGQSGPELLRREKRRARKNILERPPRRQDMSDWMIYTPRVERETRALRGYWDRFPVSPETYADALTGLFKPSGFYSEDQSFGLERKLSSFIDKRLKRATLEQELALNRAFLTVMLEKIDQVDDSYGVIGDLYGGIFKSYIALPHSELSMALADFFQDLLELLIWEDYGFTDDEQPAFFADLTPTEATICEPILRTQWQELDTLDLNYQSEEALTLLGLLCTQQRQFEQFVDLARLMGTRHWQRITRLAEQAEQSGQVDLALAVYEAPWKDRACTNDTCMKSTRRSKNGLVPRVCSEWVRSPINHQEARNMSITITLNLQKPEAIAIVEAIPPDELDAALEDYILIADRILRSVRVSERDALSEIFGRLDGFEQTFRQVLGAVSKSQKRGDIGEAEVLLDLNMAYGPADKFVSVGKTGHAGDIVGTLSAGERILIEVKNYTDSVPTPEVEKFWRDMRENNYTYGAFISLQSPIRGMPTENFAYRQEGPRRAVFVVNSAFDNIGHRMALEYIRRLIELERLSAVAITSADLASRIAAITDQLNVIRDSLNLAADIRKTAQDTTQTVQQNMSQVTERILELQVRIRNGLENIDRVLRSLEGYRVESLVTAPETNWLTIIDILPEDYKLTEAVRTICAGLAGYGLTFQPGENGLHQVLHQDQVIGCLEIASNRVTLLTSLDAVAAPDGGGWKSVGKKGSYQWKWDFKSAKEIRENISTITHSFVVLKG